MQLPNFRFKGEKMIIYGAGLTGLIAANIFQRSYTVEIKEAINTLPHNHQALLRFRTPKVGEAVGIPFRQVTVQKAAMVNGQLTSQPDLRSNNLYSQKVTGAFHNRSILDLRPSQRWIAPRGLVYQLASQLQGSITYGQPLTKEDIEERVSDIRRSILVRDWVSTIPLPMMIELAGWKPLSLQSRPIAVIHGTIKKPNCDLYQTIYFPDPQVRYYRASITGNQFILEFTGKTEPSIQCVEKVLSYFGISAFEFENEPTVSHQGYGKILPSQDDQERKKIILGLTDMLRIYSLGRFAVWRQILQDDVIQDITRINVWMSDRSGYQRRLSS